jgi:hypothetical protein
MNYANMIEEKNLKVTSPYYRASTSSLIKPPCGRKPS